MKMNWIAIGIGIEIGKRIRIVIRMKWTGN